MMNRIIYAIFILLFFGQSQAQNTITSNDEIVIRRKAIGLVKDLEYKYNQLLGADSEDRNIMIDNMTLPTDGNISTFVNDQVIIEDDFQTRESKSNDIPTKKVDIYFKELCSSYGKQDNGDFANENKNIVFSNITTSKIMAISTKDPLFIKIFFEVNYKGIDKRTNLPYKQPSKRVAEISISRIKNSWLVSINTIRFLKPIEEDFSKNVNIEIVAITPELQKSLDGGVRKINKSLIAKVGAGVLGIGAGIYALKLNNDWNTKLSAIDKASQSRDYAGYLSAYDDASTFQDSQKIRNLCVGIAVTAAAAELYMFLRKPKKQKLTLLPASNSVGLVLNYKF